jgi:ABC-type multidrug transport system fused ATPase/permease subunit
MSNSSSIVEATAAANRILGARPAEGDQGKLPELVSNDGPAGVEFQDVSFSYSGRDVIVLDKISLKVNP